VFAFLTVRFHSRGPSTPTKGSSGNIRIEYHTIGLFLDFRCLRSLLPPFG